jgi:F0F1-type ATP synthase assembly protein I
MATEVDFNISDLEKMPREPAVYTALQSSAGKARSYDAWGRELANWIYGNQKIEMLKSPSLKQFSNIGESERDFRVRIQQNAREQRDTAAEKLRNKYEPKLASLEEKIRRAQAVVEREAEQAKQQKAQMAISVGATLLGAFLGGGKSRISTGTLGRATTAARGASRIKKESQDVGRAQDTLAANQQRLKELEADFKAELDSLAAKIDPLSEELERLSIRPAKKDILVRLTTLVWLPNWRTPGGKTNPAWL